MPHQAQSISNYHAGDALKITVTVEDSDGNAIDISGANVIEWYLKDNATDSDADAILSKTKSGGGITFTSDGTDGKFDIKIDTSDTDGESGTKHHRARLKDSDDDRSTLFHGDFTIST